MRILIVSHSYVAAENQKNTLALERYVTVKVVLPHFVDDPILGRMEPGVAGGSSCLVFRRLSLPRNQYLLAAWDLGMKFFQPDVVHIEYDPWSIIFW